MKKFAIGGFARIELLSPAGVGVVWFRFGDNILAGLDALPGAAQWGDAGRGA